MSEQTLSLAARIRSRIDLVPTTMRGAVDRLLERVRTALDLPSRSELAELTHRLEELDRKISALAAERVAEMTKSTPALPAPVSDSDVKPDA